MELIGSEKRTIGSAAVGISVALGELILNLIVWNIPYWRHFLLIIACPAPLFLLYNFVLEDSMRWLLTNGRNEEAFVLLYKIARWNHFAVSQKVLDEIAKDSKVELKQNIATEKFNLKLLFSSPPLLKRYINILKFLQVTSNCFNIAFTKSTLNELLERGSKVC